MKKIIIIVATCIINAGIIAAPLAEPTAYLVKAEQKAGSTAEALQKTYPFVKAFIKNGFTPYRITYHTKNVAGKDIIASGALLVPDVEGPFPLLNYNHGTILPSRGNTAPSFLPEWSAEFGIAKLFASNGYLVALPDYIGYGETKNELHPYGAYKIIAGSAVDMLRAVQEFCSNKQIGLSGKNFFSGWSEGAAVGLAVVKQLEEEPVPGLTPGGTVLNAGPYYSSAFMDHILDADTSLRYMKTYVWVLRSYNWIYDINKPASYYFKQPYAKELDKDEEADLPQNPQELLTTNFREGYKDGKDSLLARALKDNDLWNWKPQSKVVFCHGDKDDYVPIFNSEKAYREMKALDADVTLKVFKGQNHASGAFAFLQTAFDTFEKLR